MATTLLALIDDIASVLDDVSLLTKVAARKTASVLGDDLALNAEQIAGVRANRELPVVWAVAKGSLRNKAILVPTALAISALAPWAIMPLLMVGGLYLCFEGFEKVARHLWQRSHPVVNHASGGTPAQGTEDLPKALEQKRIAGAIRTDFILSAEIIVITLSTVANAALLTQVLVLSGVAVLMTIGVYGLVAGIVRLDDAGAILAGRAGDQLSHRMQRRLGYLLLTLAPWLMRLLSVAGTLAMFLVGGGILAHGIPGLAHGIEAMALASHSLPGMGSLLAWLTPPVMDLLIGLIAGALTLRVVQWINRPEAKIGH